MKKPQRITDLVENIDLYIEMTRGKKPEEIMVMISFWEDYVIETIRGLKLSDISNKKLITEITDNLYRKAMDFKIIDLYTNGYIAIVLNRLYWELSQKGVRIFYILDNWLRDDRLKIILEQFPPAGFEVITPHIGDKLEYKPVTTKTENLPYTEIEKKIEEALKLGKNIFYIERDDSVNYLDKVVELARNVSDKYTKIFRNTSSKNLKITELHTKHN